MERFIGFAGLAFFLFVAFLMSEDRKSIKLRPIVMGIALQFLIALFVLKTLPGRMIFDFLNDVIGYMQIGRASCRERV